MRVVSKGFGKGEGLDKRRVRVKVRVSGSVGAKASKFTS